jgi:hypothetical protein
MPTGTGSWWTDEKVQETVTSAYIHSHLRANEQEILQRRLYFGNNLTNDTYLDWILTRAKRFFLILVGAGIPDQIFGIIDDSFDDDDLPIAEVAVPGLRLSLESNPTLDKRFYRTQFKYLARVVEDGEHIRYADEEAVPVTAISIKSALSINKDSMDSVRLPSDANRVFVRRKIHLDSSCPEEHVLNEIAEMKRFSHEHILSVFGSYTQGSSLHILSSPAGEYTLKAFLMDQPKAYESLQKAERRQILINWPHCLANGLAWLHVNGGHHGAIRPSNIYVTQTFQICLGQMDGEGVLCSSTKSDDIEAYQYAPPERWKRAVTVQSTGAGKISLPSGGRSGQKLQNNDPNDPSTRRSASSLGTHDSKEGVYTFQSASKSEFARLRLSNAPSPGPGGMLPTRKQRRVPTDNQSTDSFGISRSRGDYGEELYRAPSVLSSLSSEGRSRSKSASGGGGLFMTTPESRTAVVQTWRSVQHDSFAADIFSLGAVMMDILTVLCKRTFSSFARHRSKNNRNAGRGGGLADASFHANLGQVLSWAQILSDDAEKKVKKDDSRVLSAVGAVLQIVVQCLERVPESRLKSDALERRLTEHIRKFAGIDPLHCVYLAPEPRGPSKLTRERLEASQPGPSSSRQHTAPRQRRVRSPIPEVDDTELTVEPQLSPRSAITTRPWTANTVSRSMSPPAISLESLSSLHIDLDGKSMRSDTIVANSQSAASRDVSLYSPTSDRETSLDMKKWRMPEPFYQRPQRHDLNYSSESVVDPRLTLTSTEGSEGGNLTYMNYSTSPESDDENRSSTTYHYPLPPTQPPPKKNLPAVPARSQQRDKQPHPYPQPHQQAQQPPPRTRKPRLRPQPSDDEIAMLRQLSLAQQREDLMKGRPMRGSSLADERRAIQQQQGQFYEERTPSPRRPGRVAPPVSKFIADERMYRYRA